MWFILCIAHVWVFNLYLNWNISLIYTTSRCIHLVTSLDECPCVATGNYSPCMHIWINSTEKSHYTNSISMFSMRWSEKMHSHHVDMLHLLTCTCSYSCFRFSSRFPLTLVVFGIMFCSASIYHWSCSSLDPKSQPNQATQSMARGTLEILRNGSNTINTLHSYNGS
jgi:hypothetical protein